MCSAIDYYSSSMIQNHLMNFRNIIRQCVNASKDDVVIFTGSGATAAVHKLLWGLKINHQRVAEDTVSLFFCVLSVYKRWKRS